MPETRLHFCHFPVVSIVGSYRDSIGQTKKIKNCENMKKLYERRSGIFFNLTQLKTSGRNVEGEEKV